MLEPSQPSGLPLTVLLGRIADFTEDVILISEAEPFDVPGPRIVYVNEAFTRMTGYAPHEVLGQTPRILQGPRTDPLARARIRAALEDWKPIQIELLNYRKDGSEFWVELSITPVADSTGWFRYWVSVQRETSERHRRDEQQRLNELILNNISEGIVVADALKPGFPIEFANSGFSAMTGYRLEDIMGGSCSMLQGKDTSKEAIAKLSAAMHRGEPMTVELLNFRKDGAPFWNLMTVTPLRDALGKVIKFVGVQRDVTSSKEKERELVASQRLRAVGEMTGGIAHDFNNLLTAISGASELMLRRAQDDPALLELARTVHSAASRGTAQVRRLLAFSRTPLLARGRVDLRGVLSQLELLLESSLRDDIELHVDLPPDARWVDAEAVQLESALLNLVLNAQDAMSHGGRIEILAELVIESGREMVHLQVKDSGSGMDEKTLACIFEPFFTTKPEGRGSGLGLPMVRSFVTQLGGYVDVSSTPGQGTSFVLALPAIDATETVWQDLDDEDFPALASCHVLLVEDDDVVRVTAHAMLTALGHQAIEVANADDAIPILASEAPIDLLFTDLLMPGKLSGRQLAREACRLRPGLPIVLTSGWADSDLPEAGEVDSRLAFLLKPYSLTDLQRAIADVTCVR